MKLLCSLTVLHCLAVSFAWAQAKLPLVNSATVITPITASNQISLSDLASDSRVLAQRDYIGIWRPHGVSGTADTAGTSFPISQTVYATIEVEDDFTAAQILFANVTTTPFTIKNLGLSASSQWATSGYTGSTPGITPYDASGSTVPTLQRGTFANAGANSEAFPPTYGTNCLTTSAAASKGASTLSFASVPDIATGQLVATTARGGNYIQPQTTVTAATSTSVTLSHTMSATLPSGSYVCFLASGVTVAGSAAPPVPMLTRSDWIPVRSLARIDSPVVASGAVVGTGIAAGTTVASSTATTVTLSQGASSAIPAGTSINFCRATKTVSTFIPASKLNFITVPATVVPGMYARPVSAIFQPTFFGQNFPSPATVTATSGTTVTLSQPLNTTVASGATWAFYQQLTVGAAAATGVTTLTLSSVPANLTTGMYLVGTGINGAKGAAFTPTTTITAIRGNVITVSAATIADIAPGDSLNAVVQVTTNAATTVGALSVASTTGIYPGAMLTGTGLLAETYANSPGNGTMALTRSPAVTIPSGTTINACDPLVTSAETSAGGTTLTFHSITYPKRLLTIRLNVGSAGANFYLLGGDAAQSTALLVGSVGAGRMEAGRCGAGNDGVLSPSSIGNGTGGCGRTNFFPIWGVKFQTARRGIVIATVGDSHFAGDTSAGSRASIGLRAAAKLSNLGLPVWFANLSYGGQNSATFLDTAWPTIQEVKPTVLVMAGYTWNDVATSTGQQAYLEAIGSLARYVRGYGGLPVLATEYARQVAGCNSSSAANEALRQGTLLFQLGTANDSRLPVLDTSTIMADPVRGNAYIDPAKSSDCIHANDAGHAAGAAGLVNLLRSYLAN